MTHVGDDAAEGANVCIFGDDERMMTYTKDGRVAHTNMRTLRTRDRDGVDVELESRIPTATDHFRRRSIDDTDPIFERALFSDSEDDDTDAMEEKRPKPGLQAQDSGARFTPDDEQADIHRILKRVRQISMYAYLRGYLPSSSAIT